MLTHTASAACSFLALCIAVSLTGDCLPAAETDTPPDAPGRLWVYFGTYTNTAAKSKGIYLGQLDLASGKLEAVQPAGEAPNPSFLALHPCRPLLYAVAEMSNFNGKGSGAVSAFSIERTTGKLTPLGQQSSGGSGPCHVLVDRSGQCVLVANYGSGSVASLPIREDGGLQAACSVIQHSGSSVNPQRQQGPHAHGFVLDRANRIALAADLGLDKILIYRLDADCGKLSLNRPAWVDAPAGAGPRHMAFHPNGRWLYAINELNSTVTAYCYDASRGALKILESLSTLPEDFKGGNGTAEIAVHPSGKFLYGSNRGHNSIAIFGIDAQSGKLRPLGHQSTRGKSPRSFAIDPTGRILLAANQDTDNVAVFRIDPACGGLEAIGETVAVPAPVCIVMMRPLE
jgi:6-phosphogluconolactonase